MIEYTKKFINGIVKLYYNQLQYNIYYYMNKITPWLIDCMRGAANDIIYIIKPPYNSVLDINTINPNFAFQGREFESHVLSDLKSLIDYAGFRINQ